MKRIFLIIFLSVMTLPLWAVSYTLCPGLLATALREIERSGADRVTFDGEIYSSELSGLRRLPRSVTNLDLSQLAIKGDACELPPFALFATNVKVLKLPETLTAIGEGALADTPLESLMVPAGVSEIGPRAFYDCRSLGSVNLSYSRVARLPDECFSGCSSLEELWLPSTLSEIGERALMLTAIQTLAIPSVKKMERYALAGMPQLSSLTLSNGVKIEEGALFNTPHLQGVGDIILSVPVLGFALTGNAADGKLMDSPVIGEGAFAGTSLGTILLGGTVEVIEAHAFRNVSGLTEVDVTAKGEAVPKLDEEAFSGVDISKIRLRVLNGSEQIWREAPVWKDFMIESSSKVEEIAVGAKGIRIEKANGMVNVSSDAPLEYVGIYSLGGMVLYEHHSAAAGREPAQAGEVITAGPFDEPAVIVRAVTASTTHVATLALP